MAINISSYRDDSSAKPPSSSRTLQKRTPFTNGTDDSSSKSKSTRNLNLFFLLRMKDMLEPRGQHAAGLEPSPPPGSNLPRRRARTFPAPASDLPLSQLSPLVGGCRCSLLSPTTPANTTQSSNLLFYVVE